MESREIAAMPTAQTYDYGLWGMVALNVVVFGAFAVGLLRPRRAVEWRSLGVFSAFIVALFAEMYGFPLTIYLLSGLLGASLGGAAPFGHLEAVAPARELGRIVEFVTEHVETFGQQ